MQNDMPIFALPDLLTAIHSSGTETQSEGQGVISACERGDRLAQQAIYTQHSSHVYRLMFRMVGRDNAEDLTQQVFLKLFHSIGKFTGRSTFSTWLYRLATNEALQFIRRQRRRAMPAIVREPVDQCRDAPAELEDAEFMEWALSRLDPEIRSVFILREMQRLSYYEIALVLDIAEGTVASRLNRARRSLLELLKPVVDR